MTNATDKSLRERYSGPCQDAVAESPIIAARVKDDGTSDWRLIDQGDVESLLDYVLNDKTEEEAVQIWPLDKVCLNDNWVTQFPVGMLAGFKQGFATAAARRSEAFDTLSDGLTLRTQSRDGYLYFRESDRMIEMYVEMSGVAKYDFLLAWEGLDQWVYPEEVATSAPERTRIQTMVAKWLSDEGSKTNPPDPIV